MVHYRITNLRAWRKYRNLTQAALADRVGTTAASISRLETGLQPYTQPLLEQLAEALRCDPADLIIRLPPGSAEHELWQVVNGLKPDQQAQVLRVIKAMTDAA